MKAMQFTQYGTPDVLELVERERPVPADDKVLVKVHASSINDWDWQLLQGIPLFNRFFNGLFKPKKVTVLGCDVAGVVEAVGKDIQTLSVGDEVYGDLSDCGFGAFAEYVCAKENAVIKKPESMTFEQAASLPQAGLLALQGFYFKGGPRKSQKILINGASGGVGTLALQMARYFEAAEVTGVCSGAKFDLVKSLGADHLIDYQKEDFSRNGQQYDLILDVKGFHKIWDYKRSLAKGGIYVLQGGGSSTIFQTLILGTLISLFSKKQMAIQLYKANKGLSELGSMFEAHRLKPVIDKVFSLENLPEAMSYYGSGKARGKVVVKIVE